MIRITNNAMVQNTLYQIRNNQAKLMSLENQISSGKRFQRPSEDPIGTAFSMKTNARVSEINQYMRNLDYSRNWLDNSEASLSSITDVLGRVKELTVRGATGTLAQSDRDAIATEMNTLLQHVLDLTNADMAGQSLFAGNQTDKRPFVAASGTPANVYGRTVDDMILGVQYQGDRGILERDESSTARIQINDNGESAFMNVTRQHLFSTRIFTNTKQPLTDNLRDGYFTVSGRLGDETIAVNSNDSLLDISNKINTQSRQVVSRIVSVDGGYRMELEAKEKGKLNQVSITAGGPEGVYRRKTNLLDILGTTSVVTSALKEGSAQERMIKVDPNLNGGYFFINGNLINVDPAKDSFSDIARRINDLKQDLRADVVDGSLRIHSTGTLTIKDGTSNLSTRMGFPTERYQATRSIQDEATDILPLEANEWIRSGNFYLNGQSIGILDGAHETMSDLMNRVNSSAVGVNMRMADMTTDGYDDRIIFETNNGAPISSFQDGTSQFIKSFEFSYKSNSAITPAPDTNLASIGVNVGSRIRINNVEFEVNAADSLQTIAMRVNSANIGVHASVEEDKAVPGTYRFALSPNGVVDGLDTTDFGDVAANPPTVPVAGNLFSTIGFGSRIESSPARTSEFVERPLKYARFSGIDPTLDYDKGPGITSGWVVINNREYFIDAENDMLSDVAARINSRESGIFAHINDNNELILDAQENMVIFDADVFESASTSLNPAGDPLSNIGISSGTININGKAITVDANGTMDGLIRQINASGANAKAWYDPADGTLKIRSTRPEDELVIGAYSGTAGESNAMLKLGAGLIQAASAPQAGWNTAADPLSNLGVTGGTLTINGVNINVNAAQSLDTMINNINALVPDVTARWDAGSEQLFIESDTAGGQLTISPFTGAPGQSDVLQQFGMTSPTVAGRNWNTNFFDQLGMTERTAQDSLGNTRIEQASSAGRSLFDVLIELRDKLLVGDLEGIGTDMEDTLGGGVLEPSSLRLLDDTIAHNLDVRTRVGARINRVDSSQDRHRDVLFYTEKILSDNEDVDIEKAIIDFNVLQNLYTASLQVGARVIKPTLMDFLG